MLSEMAAVEIANHRRVSDRLVQLGADPEEAMAPFRAALDAYHGQTQPSDWLEALTKAYVGDSIADDFAREVARGLSPADRDLVLEVLRESRYADFAAAEIRQALDRRPEPDQPAVDVGPPPRRRGAEPGSTGRRRATRASPSCSPGSGTPAATSPPCSSASPPPTPPGWPRSA